MISRPTNSASSYSSWQSSDHDNVVALDATSVEDLKASGMWQVLTPDDCIDLARRTGLVPPPAASGIARRPGTGFKARQ